MCRELKLHLLRHKYLFQIEQLREKLKQLDGEFEKRKTEGSEDETLEKVKIETTKTLLYYLEGLANENQK